MADDVVYLFRTDPHYLDRIKRMTQDRGHYINCRHYKKVADRLFECSKLGKLKKNCDGCMTCPNCGGKMYTYRLKKDWHRDRCYIEHDKSCTICGAYIPEQYVMMRQKDEPEAQESKCQVHGCNNTAYEGHTFKEIIHGQMTTFTICLTHKRRIKTWRLHPEKGEDQRPIIIQNGRPTDNPNYEFKQRKHVK